jgi:hypothetical protein
VRGPSPQIPVAEIYSAQAEQTLQILLFERFVTMMIDLIGDVAMRRQRGNEDLDV